MIDSYIILKKKEDYCSAVNVAKICIEHKNRLGFYINGESRNAASCSLFLGTAGIGYTFLRLYTLSSYSILTPFLKSCSINNEIFRKYDNAYLVRKIFPNFSSIDYNLADLDITLISDKKRLREKIISKLFVLSNGDPITRKALELDITQLKVLDSVKNNCELFLLYMKSRMLLVGSGVSDSSYVIRNPYIEIRKSNLDDVIYLFMPKIDSPKALKIEIDLNTFKFIQLFEKKERRVTDVYYNGKFDMNFNDFINVVEKYCHDQVLLIVN